MKAIGMKILKKILKENENELEEIFQYKGMILILL